MAGKIGKKRFERFEIICLRSTFAYLFLSPVGRGEMGNLLTGFGTDVPYKMSRR
jgi:hypothetical protein